jgi:hypothetical protein
MSKEDGNGMCLLDMSREDLIKLVNERDRRIRDLEFAIVSSWDKLKNSPPLFKARRVEEGDTRGMLLEPCHEGDPGALKKHAELNWDGDLFVICTSGTGLAEDGEAYSDDVDSPPKKIELKIHRYVKAQTVEGK